MGVTLLFPGQGSQYVGMGNLIREFAECQKVFTLADNSLGFSISSLCAEGPEDKLKLTEFTQPAIVTHSIALYEKLKTILENKNITIDRVLGHSVGEYPALVAAGVLKFEDAVKAVNLRGKFMQEAVAPGKGKMFAILRVPGEIVEKACLAVSTESEKVMCANFNDPTQVVISGHATAAEKAVKWLEDNFTERHMAKELPVSAPFHSALMQPAEVKLAEFLNSIEFSDSKIAYVANVDAKEYPAGTSGEIIKQNLIKQVCGSVLWTQSMATLADSTKCIEVGPGKVLTGLNKRINKSFETFSLDAEDAFNKLEEFLV